MLDIMIEVSPVRVERATQMPIDPMRIIMNQFTQCRFRLITTWKPGISYYGTFRPIFSPDLISIRGREQIEVVRGTNSIPEPIEHFRRNCWDSSLHRLLGHRLPQRIGCVIGIPWFAHAVGPCFRVPTTYSVWAVIGQLALLRVRQRGAGSAGPTHRREPPPALRYQPRCAAGSGSGAGARRPWARLDS